MGFFNYIEMIYSKVLLHGRNATSLVNKPFKVSGKILSITKSKSEGYNGRRKSINAQKGWFSLRMIRGGGEGNGI